MAGGRASTAIQLTPDRLLAVQGDISPAGVALTGSVCVARPASVDATDARAVGRWAGDELKGRGIGRSRVVLALGRGDVVLKVLTLPPATGGASERELVGVVRLAMLRQLAVAAEGTIVDYTILPPAADGSQRVLAGALPADRAAWLLSVADAAGLGVAHIALRAAGAGTLLAEMAQRHDGPVLGLTLAADGPELIVIEDGVLVGARAVDLPRGESDTDALAQRLAVEAKRTWLSHRAQKAGPEPACVAVLASGDLADRAARRCGEALGVRGVALGTPSLASFPATLPEDQRADALPLLGLLAGQMVGLPGLDFANPRRAPDLAARPRQLALAGMLGLILVGGVGFIAADRSLRELRHENERLREREQELAADVSRRRAEEARLAGLERWAGADIDWAAHLAHLCRELPDPRIATLDELGGRMAGGAVFSPSGTFPRGEWSSHADATIEFAGKTLDRDASAALRELLLTQGDYSVTSKGPDVPDRFAFELRTARPSPKAAAPRKTAGGGA